MFKKIGETNFFAQMFNIGLLFLFAGLFKEYFFAHGQTNFFQFGMFSFFAAGAIVCFISLIFLFAEWVMLPFGTQNKRAALYQGAGNLFAFALIGGSYLLLAEQSPLNLAHLLPFSLASGGMLVAVVFAFLGKPIANALCRKKIKLKILTVRNLPERPPAATNFNSNGTNARPLKIQKFLPEAR